MEDPRRLRALGVMTMRRACVLGWVAFLACGCWSGGGRNGLFPEGYPLTGTAKEIRAATPPPADIPRELAKAPAEPYVVEPGDVLLIQASGLDSPVRLPGDQPVLPDGTVHLGRFGRLQVAGKTIEEIERDAAALIKTQEKEASRITARLVTRESKVYYVVGEVNAPGSFPLRGREAVLDALLAAGGLNSNASRRGIILSRPTAPDSCRIVLPVCYSDIVQLGDTTTNYQIRAGDRIFVPSRTFWEDLMRLLCREKLDEGCCKTQTACPPNTVTAPLPAAMAAPVPGHPATPAKIELPKPKESGAKPAAPDAGPPPLPSARPEAGLPALPAAVTLPPIGLPKEG